MLRDLVEKIAGEKPKRVFIQLPEGLITKSQRLSELLEKKKIQAIVSLEPCYGACDIREDEAKRMNCDLIVNVGHTDMGVKTKIPVLYYEWIIRIDEKKILKILGKNIGKLGKKIGLISSVNFIHLLKPVKKFLESKGKKCFLGKGKKTKYPGQILGCDPGAGLKIEKKVDCFLFVGSGEFHPLGLFLKSKKPLYILNIEKGFYEPEFDRFLRQKYIALSRAKKCKKFGILISTKPGQLYLDEALKTREKLESGGKRGWIFSMDRITPEKLMGLDIDCYINFACPRIVIENRTQFKKPILNPDELG